MSSRLFLFFLFSFVIFNGCLYSCNYQPGPMIFTNTDPCTEGNDTKLLRFFSIIGGAGKVDINMEMLLPCKGSGSNSDTYSLAFYDANNLVQPEDLTHMKVKGWIGSYPSCSDSDKNKKHRKKVEKNPDFYKMSQGAAITIGVGSKHPNRLYPYYLKTSIDNPRGEGENCVNNLDARPFIIDPSTLSPIVQKKNFITTEQGEISLARYNYRLVEVGAPFYTYGTLINPENFDGGLKSTPGISTKGSYFSFSVNLKPGSYYIVLSKVQSPMGAVSGNFSLKDIKIYYNKGDIDKDNIKDYETDCGKNVSCGTPVKVI